MCRLAKLQINYKITFLILTLLSTGSYSCLDGIINNDKGIGLEIINNSGGAVTDIAFYTTEKIETLKFDSLANNSKTVSYLTMKNNKTDGAYTLVFTGKSGIADTVSAGYYTNGSALNSKILFQLHSDTTTVKFFSY